MEHVEEHAARGIRAPLDRRCGGGRSGGRVHGGRSRRGSRGHRRLAREGARSRRRCGRQHGCRDSYRRGRRGSAGWNRWHRGRYQGRRRCGCDRWSRGWSDGRRLRLWGCGDVARIGRQRRRRGLAAAAEGDHKLADRPGTWGRLGLRAEAARNGAKEGTGYEVTRPWTHDVRLPGHAAAGRPSIRILQRFRHRPMAMEGTIAGTRAESRVFMRKHGSIPLLPGRARSRLSTGLRAGNEDGRLTPRREPRLRAGAKCARVAPAGERPAAACFAPRRSPGGLR